MSKTLYLHVRAPFAAFRWMQAGVYRATSPVIPPSAAWGLALNIAGVETRSTVEGEVTLVRDDAPALELAVGVVTDPELAVVYQQLHSYPVGNSGKDLKEKTHGAKYWIAPAKREILVGLNCVIGVRGPRSVVERLGLGLRGEYAGARYGLLFAGDNNLLIDRVDATEAPPSARWYRSIEGTGPSRGSCRLTVGIDRNDASRTESRLFAPEETASMAPPSDAWVWVPRRPPS